MTTTARAGRHARRYSPARAWLAAIAASAVLAAGGLALASAAADSSVPARLPQISLGQPPAPLTVLPARHHAVVRRVTVRPGDCLWTIAVAHHVSERALYRDNRKVIGSNPNLIYAGMVLRLPGHANRRKS